MSHRVRLVTLLALTIALLASATLAQKPSTPAPPPAPPSRPDAPTPANSGPNERTQDLVLFLRGRVATGDGSPVPNDAMIERVCNGSVRQQVYVAPPGDFSMQLGSMNDSFVDASGDRSSQNALPGKDSLKGIPRRELTNCELRARASGFYTDSVTLVGLNTFGSNIDVGVIVVRRAAKTEGMTLSATPYKVPEDARRAYEKGLAAERKSKPANARKYFETALAIYPRYATAWFHLGVILQKDNQQDAARAAFTQAATLDTKFLPAYLSLASMAYEAENWMEVLNFTQHILDLDPLNHTNVTGYILDLDPFNCSEAYYYNAFANYELNRFEEAEKSGLKAEHLDLTTRFPQLHLLLADIFARKNDFATAIAEMQTYLELAPNAEDAARIREQLAKLEKLNGPKT
jgi:tetratricopeptide (TPR) repeat protein